MAAALRPGSRKETPVLTNATTPRRKKFANRNSIGKAKKKNGSAGRYMTRTSAVNKLQVPLKDFRKLCILKGIYPREPKKKFKGGNTTYYFAKDILFLLHEPLLAKFREQKAFLKKIRKASGRHERKRAERLDGRRPVYKLDHLIRERYPTFADALQDLDDALCLVFLFASLAPSKFVHASRVQACSRLRREFYAYVARTRTLRKVFISIKGIYYQAEVNGVTLTWVEPHHSFAQQPTMSVDYRVMLSFLELYEAIMTFVNFKLFHDLGAAYPPEIDTKADAAGVHLGAAVLRPRQNGPALPLPAASPLALTATGDVGKPAPPTAAQLSSLKAKLAALDEEDEDEDGEDGEDGGNGEGEGLGADAAAAAEARGGAWSGVGGLLNPLGDHDDTEALSPEATALRTLFAGCYLFCGRETPVPSLEFIILACGGKVGWQGEASPFQEGDACVTHQIVDRPMEGQPAAAAKRELVQPQWVYDCLNARQLLPTHAYRPGVKPPPHLSPFVDGGEGYTPRERVRQAVMEAQRAAEGGEDGEDDDDEEEENEDGEEDDDEDGDPGMDVDDGEDDEEDDEEGEEDEEDEGEMDEEAVYAAELAAELGGSYAAPTTAKRQKQAAAASGAKLSKEEEEKQLQIMMLTKKKRKLYERMQYGIRKKESAADALRAKRQALDQAAAPKMGSGGKAKKARVE